ncbi:SDR family NAD(P)-dependent oxidoreductase [Agrilactobacillus fermenti]|uniref:SDR family NAD(P)-dependent oxidoreductase n=1 Tax=Agrilactobacillus fermenti TaxID=2586909 RepID=UPI001E5FC413|nr:SDR family NAD(P)-dependent oxidoreductase [Agrilactobacillus fermenti]MCD2255236.1 SDR family NAD(P)-dependent oxidoreductase [Agrilactobacillus fermenti]
MKKLAALRNLDGKIVVITGGSSGIGRASALQAAKRGAIVIVAARRQAQLDLVAKQCAALSGRSAYGFTLDISDPDNIDYFCRRVVNEVGIPDVLINAAGFGKFTNTVDMEPAMIERLIQVDVLGTIYISRLIAKLMIDRKPGHIILLGSMAGKIATNKSAIYSAAKFAVVGYANGLRLELKPFDIQVTTVNPGPVATDFFNIADESGTYLKSVGAFTLNADRLAQRIVSAVGFSVREINTPAIMALAAHFYDIFPRIGDYLTSELFNKK